MEDRRGLEEDVRWKEGVNKAAGQEVDLFEAQKALKLQPQVLEEVAQLRSRLQETEQHAIEVRCWSLPWRAPWNVHSTAGLM